MSSVVLSRMQRMLAAAFMHSRGGFARGRAPLVQRAHRCFAHHLGFVQIVLTNQHAA